MSISWSCLWPGGIGGRTAPEAVCVGGRHTCEWLTSWSLLPQPGLSGHLTFITPLLGKGNMSVMRMPQGRTWEGAGPRRGKWPQELQLTVASGPVWSSPDPWPALGARGSGLLSGKHGQPPAAPVAPPSGAPELLATCHTEDGVPTLFATDLEGAVHWPGRGDAGLGGGGVGCCCLSSTLGQGRAQGSPGLASVPVAF